MDSLLSRIKRLQCYDATAFSEITLTGTGFSGSSRANLRSLCSKAGIIYCGDLINGWTTHLVVHDNIFNAESMRSKKIQVAAKWGVPIVRLQWLLDSIHQGEPLCIDPYLVKISAKHATPAAKAEVAQAELTAARPTERLSSKQDSTATPNRTPLHPVENVIEQLEKLAVTPNASKASKIAEAEIEGAAEQNSAPSPAATKVSLQTNSAGETPAASPCRTEIPSEMTVAVGESSPSLRPATELETEEDEEGVAEISSPQLQESPRWWDSQDDLWASGSQPQSIQTPLPLQPSEEENTSFSFGVAAVTGKSPLPSLRIAEGAIDPSSSSSTTPMSDMTPLELQRPDDMTTKTRVKDSPPSSSDHACDGEQHAGDYTSNMQQQRCSPSPSGAAAVGEIIQCGGQPEWWEEDEDEEEDCISVDNNNNNNIETACGGCQVNPAKERENAILIVIDEGGEEPSPLSIACSNHDYSDAQENQYTGLKSYNPREDQQQQQEEESIEDFEDSPQESQIIARARAPLPPLPPIPSGLPQAADDAVPLKVLHRAPRGSTVKARYRLVNTKAVTFAEAVHLRGKQLTLNVKDKQQAILLGPIDSSSSTPTTSSKVEGATTNDDDENSPILAEPLSFYRCLGEDMQMEYHRLYTGTQALALAEKAGVQLRLPPGFDASVELFKGTAREHADMRRVAGTVSVRKGKLGVHALKTKSAQGGKPVRYWRCEFDAGVPEVLMP
ncbi:hypothetical protein Ndes2526B_g02219 [Nannochloris sp. 'desiccata']|nr:hypothetical protein KSW81_003433 [Chlorella desiccata (nom. nud.)]KAH7622931.1 hypothetical protein NADE_007796 [Chlorella desiccata (nom. nud.)]